MPLTDTNCTTGDVRLVGGITDHWKVGLRSATTTSGEQSVMTHGVHMMLEWSVVSWDTPPQVSEFLVEIL